MSRRGHEEMVASSGSIARSTRKSKGLQNAGVESGNEITSEACEERLEDGNSSSANQDENSNHESQHDPQPDSSQEQRVTTCFSITSLHKTFSKFNAEKREIVQSLGFQSLLKLLPHKKFPRQLALWLLRGLTCVENGVKFGRGEEIWATSSDVELVIGVPRKSRKVKYDCGATETDIAMIKSSLMLGKDDEVSIECVEEILSRDYGASMSNRQKRAFKVAFVLYVDAYFLGAKGPRAKINEDMFTNLAGIDKISELDWCGYVLNCLIDSSMKVNQSLRAANKTVTVEGCLLFPVVFYLDNLNFGNMTPLKSQLPTFLNYANKILWKLEREDKDGVGATGLLLYGRTKVLECDRVIYSRRQQMRAKRNSETKNHDKPVEVRASLQDAEEVIAALRDWEMTVIDKTKEAKQTLTSFFKERVNGGSKEGDDAYYSETMQSRSSYDMLELATKEKFTVVRRGDISEYKIEKMGSIQNNQNTQENDIYNMEKADHCSSLLRETGCLLGASLEQQPIIWGSPSNTTDAWMEHSAKGCDSESTPGAHTYSNLLDDLANKLKELGIDLEAGDGQDRENTGELALSIQTEHQAPLLIVTPAIDQEIVCYEEDVLLHKYDHRIAIGNTKMVVQYINNDERFGVSPFTIALSHPDAPLEGQLSLHFAMRNLTEDETSRFWYVHLHPNRIQLKGSLIHQMIEGGLDFVPVAMDALVRLYSQLDEQMYLKWDEARWRHYVPTDFAVWALSEHRTDPPIYVQQMFLGQNFKYRVSNCRLIMIPVLVEWNWCLYVWDYKRKKLKVLDPTGVHDNIATRDTKHSRTITKMHSAIQDCHGRFLNDHNQYMDDWGVEYVDINSRDVQREDSGLYTMYCARYFDGDVVTRILTREACQLQRVNLVYQLLVMEGNIGGPPMAIKSALDL